MDNRQTICLLNDSFPPVIDGVANAVKNYAEIIHQAGQDTLVITPSHPGSDDTVFPYPVIRYPSLDFRKVTGGYTAGIPFSPAITRQLGGRKVALLHSHCPVVSTILGRELRRVVDAPLVMTYHTKFDIEINKMVKGRALKAGTMKALVQNVSACNEVWAVSAGAADNLRSMGYEGECVVMPNGVDLPLGRVSQEAIDRAIAGYDLPQGVPLFLFVGRIMWYKGLKIIADALAMQKAGGADFRMVFIGSGAEQEDVKAYIGRCGIGDKCIFTGPIRDRETLRAWYCRADLFLFPSTFDTNGLVVREAAASSLGAVLIAGSCAAEGITDGVNGLLIEENAESLNACLTQVLRSPEIMAQMGQRAARDLYISWHDAVHNALRRYEVVIDRYRSGQRPAHQEPMEQLLETTGILMEDLAQLPPLPPLPPLRRDRENEDASKRL